MDFLRQWAQQNPGVFPFVVLLVVFCGCVAAIWAITYENDAR